MGQTQPHYHIRWVSGTLDWERHNTHDGAEESAKRLERRDEEHTIVQCQGTRGMCNSAAANHQGLSRESTNVTLSIENVS